MKVKKYIAPTMQEAMGKIRNDLGSEAFILQSRQVRTGGFFGFFTKQSVEVIALLDVEEGAESADKAEKAQSSSLVEKSIIKEDIPSWQSYFNDQGVSHLIIEEIIADMQGTAKSVDATRWLEHWLLDRACVPLSPGSLYDTQFLTLVGPTGVGKTTTLAKLAAKAKLEDGKKVAFITMDTYRIGAVEQLKTYAEILKMPLKVAYNTEVYEKAKQELSSYDLVLTDTAGRNFLNPESMDELGGLLQDQMDHTKYLVLSLTSKYEDLKHVIKHFSQAGVNRLILTKKDETASLGALLNLLLIENTIPLYITNGQNVPDDISTVTPKAIISMFLQEKRDA
ncbi:flagellar biosynthesis protein FlhF [Fictibacillus enclensis]|uniref:flagellar biosynthesis protein FlhF n=1 Tax=Fictibacillus enclensis TaxID=1017270 RepID=UPI00259FEAAA|nr:flagellar biosynthesis protein FlhF [Fictibacillus enclensis]MDM5198886.1 flagellar biosynthesis protein FlhF [Fictibacillus enclensis]